MDIYLAQLNENLTSVISKVDRRVPQNSALTIDRDKGKFHLAALKGKERPDAVKVTKGLIQGRLAKTDLVDVLIDLDNQTFCAIFCTKEATQAYRHQHNGVTLSPH